jgi:hypothetical protein
MTVDPTGSRAAAGTGCKSICAMNDDAHSGFTFTDIVYDKARRNQAVAANGSTHDADPPKENRTTRNLDCIESESEPILRAD